MKLSEITKSKYGTDHLDCLVSLEVLAGNIWFTDNNRDICFKVSTQEQLDSILKAYNFN
jgi:hypothetical protein